MRDIDSGNWGWLVIVAMFLTITISLIIGIIYSINVQVQDEKERKQLFIDMCHLSEGKLVIYHNNLYWIIKNKPKIF